MSKFLFKALIIIFLTSSSVIAEVLKEIEINGNQRISKETIIVLGEIKKDVDYNNDSLNNILKNLYDTKFFNDIQLQLIEGKLILNLIENPIIENIEITGIKRKELTETLLEKINLKNRMSFTKVN